MSFRRVLIYVDTTIGGQIIQTGADQDTQLSQSDVVSYVVQAGIAFTFRHDNRWTN